MKTLLLFIVTASAVFAQCSTPVNGPSCNAQAPCDSQGILGVCANRGKPGGAPVCGCSVNPSQTPIPLDNTWILLYSTGHEGSLFMTGAPGGPYQHPIADIGYDNPIGDGALTQASTPLSAIQLQFSSDVIDLLFDAYIWWPVPNPGVFSLANAKSLIYTVNLATAPNTVFNWLLEDPANTCQSPLALRPMISVGSYPTWEEFNTGETGRWWSDTQYVTLSDLAGNAMPGTTTITVSLDPSQWSGVEGQSAVGDPNFAAAIAAPYDIGMTIGAGCYFGHGAVVTQGSATLQILGVSYQ